MLPTPKGENVVIITGARRLGRAAVRRVRRQRLEPHEDAADLDAAFRKFIPPFGAAGNPVDITGGEPPKTYQNTIRLGLEDLRIHALILGYWHDHHAADGVREAGRRGGRRVKAKGHREADRRVARGRRRGREEAGIPVRRHGIPAYPYSTEMPVMVLGAKYKWARRRLIKRHDPIDPRRRRPVNDVDDTGVKWEGSSTTAARVRKWRQPDLRRNGRQEGPARTARGGRFEVQAATPGQGVADRRVLDPAVPRHHLHDDDRQPDVGDARQPARAGAGRLSIFDLTETWLVPVDYPTSIAPAPGRVGGLLCACCAELVRRRSRPTSAAARDRRRRRTARSRQRASDSPTSDWRQDDLTAAGFGAGSADRAAHPGHQIDGHPPSCLRHLWSCAVALAPLIRGT